MSQPNLIRWRGVLWQRGRLRKDCIDCVTHLELKKGSMAYIPIRGKNRGLRTAVPMGRTLA